jgi:peptide/nickel transport system substrate-binding protein
MDLQWTTTTLVLWAGLHMYEALFTYDSNYGPIPDLAESWEMSQDGLTHQLKLRHGVPFHNGKEMTAEDVQASLERWAKLAGAGKTLFGRVDKLSAPDKYTVEFKLKEVYPTFANALCPSGQGPVIYPKEIVVEAADGEIKQYIGTGPYKFEEWQRDRFLRMVRFDGYVPHGDKPNGYGGRKMAYLDEIRLNFVAEPSTRLAGLLSGEYDRADGVPGAEYPQLKNNPSVNILWSEAAGTSCNIINMKSPITSNLKLRQAMLAATDCEPILVARQGGNLDACEFTPAIGDGRWRSDASKELFDQNNLDKAKQLLKESGYNGEPIRWLTTKEFPGFYELAVVHSQQLEAAGIKVELLVHDWATVVSIRAGTDTWEVLTSGWGLQVDPILCPQFNGSFVGWWQTETAEALRKKILSTPGFDERYGAWEDLQRLWYEEVPAIHYGKSKGWNPVSPKVMCDEWLETWTRAMWNAYLVK